MRDDLDHDTAELSLGLADDLPAAAEELATDPSRWPRQLAELTDAIEDELGRLDEPLEPLKARRLAGRLIARIAREFGGTSLYLPKGDALETRLRDARLWAEYDGTVHGPNGVYALALKSKLTWVAVYRILARQRALHRRLVHGDLFSDAGQT